jgi:exosortase/archaeosortase family protein
VVRELLKYSGECLFFLRFFSIVAVSQALLIVFEPYWLESLIASAEAALLGLRSTGNIIYMEGQPFAISANCTGLLSSSVFAAIVFSLRKPELKKKIAIALAGISALFALNFVRVYLVMAAGNILGMQWLNTAHLLSWFAMFGAVLGAWYFLTKKSAGGISGMLQP